jgi:hypothetical protein
VDKNEKEIVTKEHSNSVSMKVLVALLSIACVCGCSANKSLAKKLGESDRIVVINPRDGLSITVTGEEVDKIVKAIGSGKKEPSTIEASPDLDLQFFKGTNRLATVTTSVMAFWVGRKAYSDQTGTLEALGAKYHEAHLPQFSP